jgi:hypothetical protein
VIPTSSCDQSSTIPTELGSWTNFANSGSDDYFTLASNHLRGTLPTELGQWTAFSRYFNLNDANGSNKLKGSRRIARSWSPAKSIDEVFWYIEVSIGSFMTNAIWLWQGTLFLPSLYGHLNLKRVSSSSKHGSKLQAPKSKIRRKEKRHTPHAPSPFFYSFCGEQGT